MLRRSKRLAVLGVLALLLSATAGEAAGLPGEQARARRVQRIRIVDNRFRNGSITIERGTVVKWINRGDNPHTTTSDGAGWDSGILMMGDRFRRKFRRVGTFPYHCEVHPQMTGTITVVPG